jgi:chorismate synthase
MSSTFGTLFRVTSFGGSHCRAVGCVVDGCPPRIALREGDIQGQLSRRRPGRTSISTPRDEEDRVSILSGTEGGLSLGTPITLMVHNIYCPRKASLDASKPLSHIDKGRNIVHVLFFGGKVPVSPRLSEVHIELQMAVEKAPAQPL